VCVCVCVCVCVLARVFCVAVHMLCVDPDARLCVEGEGKSGACAPEATSADLHARSAQQNFCNWLFRGLRIAT